MKLFTIVKYLNNLLDIENIKDDSINGLQVDGKRDIETVGFAVDSTLETFKIAKKNNVDLIVTHHGLVWKNQKIRITDLVYEKIKYLIENEISLYCVHHPLDVHLKYGNHICLLKKIGALPKSLFGLWPIDFEISRLKNSLHKKDFKKAENFAKKLKGLV